MTTKLRSRPWRRIGRHGVSRAGSTLAGPVTTSRELIQKGDDLVSLRQIVGHRVDSAAKAATKILRKKQEVTVLYYREHLVVDFG
jgi:hypothetical protein